MAISMWWCGDFQVLKGHNLKIEPDMVRLEGPIREMLLYAVKLHLGHDIDSEVKVLVTKQHDVRPRKNHRLEEKLISLSRASARESVLCFLRQPVSAI